MSGTLGSPLRPGRGLAKFLLITLAAAALLFAAYTLFMLWFSYSEGERAGVLQKFSKRGWICKTYEGELALYVVGGVAPQIWHFSVRDEDVARQLHRAVGQQVRIHYQEHRGLPTTCFGETDYFADGLEVQASRDAAPEATLRLQAGAPGATSVGYEPAPPPRQDDR